MTTKVVKQTVGAARFAQALSDRYGVEVDPVDLLDLLAEKGFVLAYDDGSNLARQAWIHAQRVKAAA
jgi:hypothetical protein